MVNKFWLIIIFAFVGSSLFAQTPNGPGGVQNTGGASNLSFWFDANNGVSLTGINVTSWSDLSGRSNTATPPAAANRPKISTLIAGLNNLSAIRFDGTNSYLTVANNAALNSTQWTFFVVGKVTTNKDYNYFFGKGNDGSENYEFLTYANPYIHTPILFTTGARAFLNTANPTAALNSYSSWEYDYSTGNGRAIYLNGALNTSDSENRTPQTNTNAFQIGSEQGAAGRILDGDIAELIMYRTRLNAAERIVVQNYLAAKYGLSMSANDVYTMDDAANGNFDFNVAGVGQSGGTQQLDSRGTGIVEIYNVGGLANGRFFMWGDNNGVLSATNTSDVPSPVQARSNRVWRVSNTGITSEDLIVDLAGLGAVTPGDLRLLIDKNNNGSFADETVAGGGIKSGFTLLAGSTYLKTGLNILNGERFTFGTINTTQTPLPIELLSFTAKRVGQNVKVNWETATEINNDYFSVERSFDGLLFSELAIVDGAGNSSANLQYQYMDHQPLDDVSYYRLKQTDFNGTYSYSNIAAVEQSQIGHDFVIDFFPNPSNLDEPIILSILSEKNENLTIEIFDIHGRRCYSECVIASENNRFELPSSVFNSSGVYLLKMNSISYNASKIIVKK